MQKARNIKVLNINYDSNPYGGVPVFLINVFRHTNHDKIQIDFLTADTSAFLPYKHEIDQAGGKIYAFHINCDSFFGKLKYGRKLRTFLKTHSYDIVHINSGAVFFDCISAIVAKLSGAKVIIHSHNAGGRSSWKSLGAYFMKLTMQKVADVLCACSEAAARNTFTFAKVERGDVLIIKDGIDLKRFQYDEKIRNKVRNDLNLKGRFVVGHIGRFVDQKNHKFLIDVFAEILHEAPTAMLLLVGEGELEPVIREKIQNLQIEDNVIFLGSCNNVEDLYQAMDVFLFPSLFEGLGIVLIEAQASGLHCCISDTITTEVDITSLIHRASLQTPVQDWATMVLACNSDLSYRVSHGKELAESGFAIEDTALQIGQIYECLTLTNR